MGNRRTRDLAIVTAVCTGIAGIGLGLLGVIPPVLLLMSAAGQRWWPRAATWLMLTFVLLLTVFMLPHSISVIRRGSGYQYHHFNYVVMHTSWLVTGPLVICCAIAILIDVVQILRRSLATRD